MVLEGKPGCKISDQKKKNVSRRGEKVECGGEVLNVFLKVKTLLAVKCTKGPFK